jgi:hypothetical protein
VARIPEGYSDELNSAIRAMLQVCVCVCVCVVSASEFARVVELGVDGLAR